METQHKETPSTSSTDCYKSKVSYTKADGVICIEHFSESGKLLSRVRMDYDDAYDYAKMLTEVADFALGVYDEE